MSKNFLRIYSDIHSCNFLDTNIFGYSFVSKSIRMSHSASSGGSCKSFSTVLLKTVRRILLLKQCVWNWRLVWKSTGHCFWDSCWSSQDFYDRWDHTQLQGASRWKDLPDVQGLVAPWVLQQDSTYRRRKKLTREGRPVGFGCWYFNNKLKPQSWGGRGEDQSEASVTVVEAFTLSGGPYKSEKNFVKFFRYLIASKADVNLVIETGIYETRLGKQSLTKKSRILWNYFTYGGRVNWISYILFRHFKVKIN